MQLSGYLSSEFVDRVVHGFGGLDHRHVPCIRYDPRLSDSKSHPKMLPSMNTSPDTVASDCWKASVITRHAMLWPTRIVLRAATRSFTQLTAVPIVSIEMVSGFGEWP